MQTNKSIVMIISFLKITSYIVIIFTVMSICSCSQKENIINEANIDHIDMFDISCSEKIDSVHIRLLEQGYNDYHSDPKKDIFFIYEKEDEKISKKIELSPKSKMIYLYESSYTNDSIIVKKIYNKYYDIYGKPTKINYCKEKQRFSIDFIAELHNISPNTINIDSIMYLAEIDHSIAEILWKMDTGNIILKCHYSEQYNNYSASLYITDAYNLALDIKEQNELIREYNITTVIIWIIVILIIVFWLILLSKRLVKKAEERKKAEIASMEAKKKKIIRVKEEYESKIKSLESSYGELTKEIRYQNFKSGYNYPQIDDMIYVFESTSIIMIDCKAISFKEILGFNVYDNSTVIYSGQTAVTKSSTGSSLGRAVVGGVLLGGVGAIIGGTTGKKETVLSEQTSSVNHSYTIVININDLTTPLIKLSLGDRQELVQEISSILTIICERNKTSD